MMRWANMALCLAIVATALAGCSTNKTVIRFNHDELQRVPPLSYARVATAPSPGTYDRYFNLVRMPGHKEKLRVKAFRPPDLVVAEDRDGKVVVARFRELTALERVRIYTPSRKHSRMTASDVAEVAAYAPLLPLAPIGLVVGPFMDAKEEAERKAKLAYEGMTREQVWDFLGEPARRYLCKHWIGRHYSKSEVWVYTARNRKLLRGGKVLHFGMDRDSPIFNKVYHVNSDDIWRDSPDCRDLPTAFGRSAGGDHP